jgi:hypothetical protein
MNMFRTFCLMVSLRKSDSTDSRELVDFDWGIELIWEVSPGVVAKPGVFHSGLDMIKLTASRNTGLSASEIK